jgi:AcrR family transcriptional regulator
MDRRQRKTREAIFSAFINLLSKKDFSQITVGEIIETADIGRATFYAHFETKDFLLKELCEELFCHLFDSMDEKGNGHRHIFECSAPESVFLQLAQHLKKNDNNILALLACPNNDMFLQYFKRNLAELVESQLSLFKSAKNERLPESFLINHISATFVETVKWWVDKGMKESPETLAEYFLAVV